jgi:hypothetical protein
MMSLYRPVPLLLLVGAGDLPRLGQRSVRTSRTPIPEVLEKG